MTAPLLYQRDRSPDGVGLMRAPHIELSAKEQRAYRLATAMLDLTERSAPREGLAWEISEHLRESLPSFSKASLDLCLPNKSSSILVDMFKAK